MGSVGDSSGNQAGMNKLQMNPGAIRRIGHNPATAIGRSRGSQISLWGNLVFFAATPDRPIAPTSTMKDQTLEVLGRIDERLALAGSSKSEILAVQVVVSNQEFLSEMNTAWDEWVSQESPPVRACIVAGLTTAGMKVEMMVIASASAAVSVGTSPGPEGQHGTA